MKEGEKQFNPAPQESPDISKAKEVGLGEKFAEEPSSELKGGINVPESILEPEKGVKEGEGAKIRKEEYAERRKRKAVEKSQPLKNKRMERLTRSMRAIDKGENIEEFDEKRRTVYYDDHPEVFYVMEEGKKKSVNVGDILSDYAWGIKYVPDPEMPHSVFRRLSRRILANEARRDIEDIYNLELARISYGAAYHPREIYIREKNPIPSHYGLIAEAMARELLARVSYDKNLGFTVLRANAVEDGLYKIDFKIHTSKRKRGVDMEDEKDYERIVKKLGIQMWGRIGKEAKKQIIVERAKKRFGKEIPVDDIVIIKVSAKKWMEFFRKWVRGGKPAGGPEQFLPYKLKVKLLKEATGGLVEIKDREIEKIFGGEQEQPSFAKASEDKGKLAA